MTSLLRKRHYTVLERGTSVSSTYRLLMNSRKVRLHHPQLWSTPADLVVWILGPKTTRARAAYEAWNPLLREGAKAFIDAHPDATVIIFSSWNLFLLILADPLSYGLPCQGKSRSALFVDGFHSTSAVHAIIAKELLTSLREVRATSSPLSTNSRAS